MTKTLTLEIETIHTKTRSTAREQEMHVYLRHQAFQQKRHVRVKCGLPDNKKALPDDAHESRLVRMSSLQINKCGISELLYLLNKNDIATYKIL